MLMARWLRARTSQERTVQRLGTADRGTLSVNQSGSSLNATSRSSSSGATCNWQGTAGASSIALSWTSCDAVNISGIRCPNGILRDIRLVSDSISATVSGNSANGTGGSARSE
jgi:hypothetical protein